MEQDGCVVALSAREMMRLKMIVVDGDGDDALAFLRELRLRIETSTIKGMKSHLDA